MISVIPIQIFNMLLAMGAIHPAAVCTPTVAYWNEYEAPAMACVMPAELEEEPEAEEEREKEREYRKSDRGQARPSRSRR